MLGHINSWIFDLDNTLYPASASLFPQIDAKMGVYIQNLLGLDPQAAWTVVNGRVVVRAGQLATLDLGPLLERHNRLARQLAQP